MAPGRSQRLLGALARLARLLGMDELLGQRRENPRLRQIIVADLAGRRDKPGHLRATQLQTHRAAPVVHEECAHRVGPGPGLG